MPSNVIDENEIMRLIFTNKQLKHLCSLFLRTCTLLVLENNVKIFKTVASLKIFEPFSSVGIENMTES